MSLTVRWRGLNCGQMSDLFADLTLDLDHTRPRLGSGANVAVPEESPTPDAHAPTPAPALAPLPSTSPFCLARGKGGSWPVADAGWTSDTYPRYVLIIHGLALGNNCVVLLHHQRDNILRVPTLLDGPRIAVD